MPPRFTLTNGPSWRRLLRWIASATSSLPVPLSPVISTEASVGATRPISSRILRNRGSAPIRARKSQRRSSSSRLAGAPLPSPLPRERQGGLHRLQELGVRPRLGDEVRRASLHPLDRQADRSPGGDQDHRHPRPQPPDRGQQLQPLLPRGGAGEVHVLEHEVELLLAQQRKGLLLRPGRPRGVAVPLEEEAQRSHHRRVVVDDQNHSVSQRPRPAAPGPPECSGRGCRGWRSDTWPSWRTAARWRRPDWRGRRSGRAPGSGPPGESRSGRPGWSPPSAPAEPDGAPPRATPRPPAADRSHGCAEGDSATARRSARARPSAGGRKPPCRPR